MAQYDLILTQNIHASGVEYAEKIVNLAKGGLLSAVADGVPTVLAGGTDGYMLVRDNAEATGLKWVAVAAGHTQNTDTGTTQTSFNIDSSGSGVKLKVNTGALEFKNLADNAYVDVKGKVATFDKVTVANAPSDQTDLTNKAYVDGILAGNNAMLFKGTIGSGGTLTKAQFEALQTYNIGWTYKVIEADTIRGYACEIGDFFTALVARAGSGAQNEDWTVWQGNLDGVVTGPASATDNYPALFNGATGKLIKAGSAAIGSMAYETAANYVLKSTFEANSILYATTASTPLALVVGASNFVGRKASGGISSLTAAEARTILNVADGATANAKCTGADIDTGTNDVNFATAKGIADSKIVKGPASATADRIALFDGVSGKLLKVGGKGLADLKDTWVTAPVAKNSTGTAGAFAYDDNYFYVCVATNTWARTPIARTWT